MKYFECPDKVQVWENERSLFLAGGIVGCSDWQADVIDKLDGTDWVLFNPRRKKFPIDNPKASYEQIQWEHNQLREASHILFWFPCETFCPIVLYELGAWSMTDKQLFIGIHPDYKRKQDVEIQTLLVRPELKIVNSLENLVGLVMDY